MPEVIDGTVNGIATGDGTSAPAWTRQLPADLRDNQTFTSYQTIGDLAKSHLELGNKVKEVDGLKARLEESVPKLPDNATDEDRNLYYNALGRPAKPTEYEFDGEDKNAPEWTNYWKNEFHSDGLTKAQVKSISTKWNTQMQKMVEAHNASLQNEMAQSEQKLKSEWGEKFDANVELAKRLYQKHLGNEFDKDFDQGSGANRFNMVRYLVKLAALTGEDRSPQGGSSQSAAKPGAFIAYDKSPAPPKR